MGKVLLKTQANAYLEYDLGLVDSDQILSLRALKGIKNINIPIDQFALQSCIETADQK